MNFAFLVKGEVKKKLRDFMLGERYQGILTWRAEKRTMTPASEQVEEVPVDRGLGGNQGTFI